MLRALKQLLVGRPLATSEEEHQRLTKKVALAIFSSDAISSTAYATEEILFVTAIGASSLQKGLSVLVPIALAVAILLAIVVISYRQTIFAYPNGGGSYVVSRENLGENPSLVAGASLLVDYILTVAVSISAGVAAIISIPTFRNLADRRVALCLALLVLITILNLRGVKESGRIFAFPTYTYIAILTLLVVYGLYQVYFGHVAPVPFDDRAFAGARELGGSLTLFVILKGFSSGAVALSGIEAISNGVPMFRRPESKNAATTLLFMGLILGSLFFGVSVLAHHLRPYPNESVTAFAQMGHQVFGGGALFWVLQLATAAILTLAANTAYAGFPMLSSIIARDGYLARQMANRGDRLVFSNGVIILAAAAAFLIVLFGGKTNALIPLYAVGVFTSFTLSQAGMVRRHLRGREPGWRGGMIINGVGSAATLVVVIVVAATKFTGGAWIPLVVIPLIIVMFKAVKRHYRGVADSLRITADYKPRRMNHTVVVLVGGVHRGVLEALAYARSLAPNHLIAVYIATEDEDQQRIERQWEEQGIEVELEIVQSRYREMTRPILHFIDELDARWDNDVVTVVLPEFVVSSWWGHLLHNQSAFLLKGRLLFRKGTVVTSVPYHIEA